MKFRLSRQRKANLEQFDLKTISPSLHDDPAFSADPYSNPYSVTSHGSRLSPPPLGHPVLKNNKKRLDIVLDSHGIPDSADFQLVQPPNSPNIPTSSGSNSSPQCPMTTNPLTMYNKLPTLSSTSTSMNQGLNPSAMSQVDRRPSLLKKENKRMNFLSRRQSAQPQPIKSFFSSTGKGERRRSDLPSFPGDTVLPQPVQHTDGLPTSASVTPQILGHRGRVQDLDQIDVLDETNPWGIRIHHDGPYEAVNVQANKRAGNAPLGLASSNGLNNAHGLQANETYIPPQVPIGVSLNLSPGQILPRQFLVPSVQPAVSSTHPGPYTPHFPAGPFLSPPSEPQYTTTFSDVTDSGSKVRNDLPVIQEATQHGDDLSSSIGMAMLELTDNAPVPSPHNFLSRAELPNKEDFDLVDPVNLGFEHRRVPSPLLSAQPEPSRDQADQSSQNASSTSTSSNKLDAIRPVGHLRNNSDPPMYNEHIDDGDQPLNGIHLKGQRQLQSSSQSSQNSLTSQNPEILVGTEPQKHFNESDNGSPSHDWRNVSYLPPDRNAPPPPAVSRDQRVEVAQGTQYTSPVQTSTPFRHPHRDGLPLPSVNHGNEPDVQSTHYSASIYSSGQFQSGRRPPNHLPKRLVMPSPLNTGPPPNAAASLHDSRVPPSQISSYVNVRQPPPTPLNQHPLHRSGNLPMASMHGNTRAQDIPVFGFGGRKLRKKGSMIVTPQAPVIATVSFAPPIVGFHGNDDKAMAQSKTEKKHKRLLSKGRK